LLALDARIEVAGTDGSRSMALADFILGNRNTALRRGRLLTAVLVPKPAHAARSHFLKLGAREYLVVSIAMVAATLEIEAGRVSAARIAVGACSPVAQRLPPAEAALIGKPCDAALGGLLRAGHLAALAPIDDVRASGAYRLDAALTLARRVLNRIGAQA
jgi:CO/xanthine dehydrogenase FAD-binding subunit